MWYSFVINKAGTVKVKVTNVTGDRKYQYRFAVYKSDVNGTLPFSNYQEYRTIRLYEGTRTKLCGKQPTLVLLFFGCRRNFFYRDPCTAQATDRYYIVVDNVNSYPSEIPGMKPNGQLEVGVLLELLSAIPTKFDFYNTAGNIGTNLSTGTYTGVADNYSCATSNINDPVYAYGYCANKTLWYKFSTKITGRVRFRVKEDGNVYYDYGNIQIFKESTVGDSTTSGLSFLDPSYIYDPVTGSYWSEPVFLLALTT